MEPEHLRVVVVVYLSALVPLLIVVAQALRGKLPGWIGMLYIGTLLACALGWELWFTYGWLAGDPVDMRRAAALNEAIPQHLNWLFNSLADAGAIGLTGVLLVKWANGGSEAAFERWHWGAFSILALWFLGQNILVEMFLYHDQLAAGKPLSWAPLAPTGPWYNPILFEFRDRTITLQGQLPWVLGAPLFYLGAIYCYRAQHARVTGPNQPE